MQYLKYLFLFFATMVVAQEKPQKQGRPESPYADDVRDLIIDGNDYLEDNAFAKAEASYREAVALDPTNVAAKYNSGNNYYENEKWEESTAGLLKATAIAQTKKEKHKAFHNLGNALYQQKDFKAAVEAYKNALRNNPTDEETRYNLALAKEEEEQNGGGGGGGDDENEDQDENQDKGQNEKNDDGEGDKEESEDGEKEETEDEGEEEENESEQKENEDGKPKDKDQEQPGDKGEQEKAPPPQPREGQLSPQQVRSLLEAMKNQEQKTQDKINAQKVKGAKVKTEKDW